MAQVTRNDAIPHPSEAAVQAAILRYLEDTTERRGAIERLPGLPGAKRSEEEVMMVGFPF